MGKRVTLLGHYPPPYGGVGTVMLQMESALSSRGWDVVIFNLGHGCPEGDNVVNFGNRNRVREVLELWRAFARSTSDVHHYITASYRSFWMCSIALLLARMTRRTMVVSFVGGAFPTFVSGLKAPARWFARYALRAAAVLIPCNDAIRGSLEGLIPGARIVQTTNIFDVADEANDDLPDDVSSFVRSHTPVIATTGAAAREYGLDVAVKGIELVRRRHPDVGWVLVMTRFGNPGEEEVLPALLKETGLDRNVLVVRGIPDFGALLANADVFLRCARVDGDSMSVREALATGMPTVASDTAFRPEGVMLYKKESPEDLAARLEEAFMAPRRDPAEMRDEARHNLETLLDVYARVT